MAGTETTVTDGFGRRVVFTGEHLIEETTDTADRRKPQWLDIDVWRTDAGSFVVKRVVQHRVAHLREDCPRLEGYEVRRAGPGEVFPCRVCDSSGVMTGELWAGMPRVTVDVYRTPQELIEGMSQDGKFTRLSRTLLADIADQDDRVDDLWNTVVVP